MEWAGALKSPLCQIPGKCDWGSVALGQEPSGREKQQLLFGLVRWFIVDTETQGGFGAKFYNRGRQGGGGPRGRVIRVY